MKKNTTYTSALLMMLLAILLGTSACRKTEYENVKRPYNGIESFTITGYGDLGEINAAIKDDSLVIYWNDKADRPAKIKPVIELATGATISPASGVEVDFADGVAYTVTAEDGTTKKFYLRPVFNTAIPVLYSMPVSYRWGQTVSMNILGEYFLAGGDVSNIKVYAQRAKDGFEFDLPIDLVKTTTTLITARLPTMTTDLDTGMHRIYVKVGNFASNSMDVNLTMPSLANDPLNVTSVSVSDPEKVLKLGDSLTIMFNIKGISPEIFEKFNPPANITSLMLFLEGNEGRFEAVELQPNDYSARGNMLKIHLGDAFGEFVGLTPSVLSVIRRGIPGLGGSGAEYYLIGAENTPIRAANGTIPDDDTERNGKVMLAFVQEGTSVKVNQDWQLNYTFSNAALKGNYTTSKVEVIFKNIATNISGGRYIVNSPPFTENGDNITFKISSSLQSTLRNYAVCGFRVTHKSRSAPVKYLKSSIRLAELNTPITN